MRQVDPYLALVRNAVFAEQGPPRVSPLKCNKSRALVGPEISAEVREQWEYEFQERVSIKVYSGMTERCGSKWIMPDCCAYHSALLEVGCLEFYAYASELPFEPGLVRATLPPISSLHCPCCESVGHVEASCPYSTADEFVTKIAVRRREAKKARAA